MEGELFIYEGVKLQLITPVQFNEIEGVVSRSFFLIILGLGSC